MKLILSIFLFITVSTCAQRDTTLFFNERLIFDQFNANTINIDTFKTEKGALMPIYISNGFIRILGFDTLEIVDVFRRLDSAQVFILRKKELSFVDTVYVEDYTNDSNGVKTDTTFRIYATIIGILRDGYFDIEYPLPIPDYPRHLKTVMFILPPKPPYSD